MITTGGSFYNTKAMTVVFSNDHDDITVMLITDHPECNRCGDDDICVSCTTRFHKPCTYRVKVQHADFSTTEDKFDKFSDAFDSFVGIVKILSTEDDWNKEDFKNERKA